jgi:FkbM family methyltransferase
MSLKNSFKKWRYNYAVSHIAVYVLLPIYKLAAFLRSFISTKVKVNGIPIRYGDVRISFPKNVGININSRIFWNGETGYEGLTSKTFTLMFQGSDVFLDIGANFGFYSVLAQKYNDHIITFCFEPLPNIYQDNIRFHKLNGVTRQRIINSAVSNSIGKTKLYVPDVYGIDSETTSASIEADFFYNRKFQKRELIIETTTLDDLAASQEALLKAKKISMKIDIEGHELAALEGGRNFFKTYKPIAIVEIERSPKNVTAIFSILDSLNYVVYALTNQGYFKISTQELIDFKGGRDFLLVPSELYAGSNYISFDRLRTLFE